MLIKNRAKAAELGQMTVVFCQQGFYPDPEGQRVDIAAQVQTAIAGTTSYPAEQRLTLPPPDSTKTPTTFFLNNETTLAAAERLVCAGERVVALNFASAKNPGGGFLGGARAQEESLARSSALYLCLRDQPMYEFHRRQRSPFYSDYAIYSPAVPVIRTDAGDLLAKPYVCSFITCAAVNAGVALQRDPDCGAAITSKMQRRIDRVLTIAAYHQYDTILLGAWGCGVFRNDSTTIAQLFHEALTQRFINRFRQVWFAVYNYSNDLRIYTPFAQAFADCLSS